MPLRLVVDFPTIRGATRSSKAEYELSTSVKFEVGDKTIAIALSALELSGEISSQSTAFIAATSASEIETQPDRDPPTSNAKTALESRNLRFFTILSLP